MTISLAVADRDESVKSSAVRSEGRVPAVVYGPKQEPLSVTMDAKEFAKVLGEAGESAIVELTGLKEPVEVLVKSVDFDPVKKGIQHVDFYAIERGKEMTTNVPVTLVGEAPAEKANIGTVTQVQHEVEVTCRPSKIPQSIEIDVSSLVEADSKIVVADIAAMDGVTINNEPEDPIAVISVAREEVEEEAPAEVDMDAIEVEEKGKGEEAADAESEG